MENKQHVLTFGQAVFIFAVVLTELIVPAVLKISLVIPIFITWPTIYILCKVFKLDYIEVEKAGLNGIGSALQTCMIVLSVGILIGAWIAAGTIPSIIYFGLKLINPRIFLLCTLIITSLMSLATGTAYGSAASAGIAMMGIGLAMGINPGMIAGAILCAATFGDKMSPLSDTTNLTPALAGTTLFKHIKSMLWTTVPAYVITCIIFTILGFSVNTNSYDPEIVANVQKVLASSFHISLIALIPIVLVIILLILKIDALPSIGLGIVSGLVIMFFYQKVPLSNAMSILYSGFSIKSGNELVDKLLNRGGLTSMGSAFYLMFFAVGMGAMLNKMGVINLLLQPITKFINNTFKLVFTTMLLSYLGDAITCGVAASHVLTINMVSPIYKKLRIAPEICSRTAEDCGTIGGIFFPWHGNTVYYTALLGVTWAQYMPYIFLSYLVPIFSLIYAATGIGIKYLDSAGNYISKKEHREGLHEHENTLEGISI